MTIVEYVSRINTLYTTGHAREHSYRGDLQTLVSTILSDILVTNEPARVSCGAPDYMLTRKDVPVGYIEAKDIGVDLNSKSLKEQLDRYKAGLNNLVITDYLKFKFYKDGEFSTEISIATLENGQIKPLSENFDRFTHLLSDFALVVSQSIKSPTRLAKMMAGKARLMADVIEKSLNSDDEQDKRSNLKSQMISFKQMLIHDITNRSFADIYSQTIAYGMFAARYHDPTLTTFSRMEAAQLIPKSNPFLRKLFQDIAGFDLDDRLLWIVDELVTIFLASDVSKIMKNFGKSTKQDDPVVHFYETFLGEYNPALRKARGVWYTPQPVVNFIVRAVDDILKEEFNLPQGLADTSKTKVTVKVPTHDKRYAGGMREYEQEVHKVQILDPATGTGTFLAEVVRQIHQKFEGQQGVWTRYATEHLIPRLNGFELLMASYAMAHLKMDMLLTETGYKPTDDQRFRIFLTNSLEEAHPDTGTLFSSWLSEEADQANAVKRDTPVMCVIGNPPYSVSSSNKGEWITKLIEEYKKNLDYNNIQPLSDDYIKFIRYGQYLIDQTGEGVMAYISNNSFLTGLIHKEMRKHLSKSFSTIYLINLHGDSKKNEKAPDGGKDENVFDIMQGVSINIFVKKAGKNTESKIFLHELYGARKFKYDFLIENNIESIPWVELQPDGENHLFCEFNNKLHNDYLTSFSLTELFIENGAGTQTKRDKLFVEIEKKDLEDRMKKMLSQGFSPQEKADYNIQDSSSYRLLDKIQNSNFDENLIRKYNYRPFDDRYIYYDPSLLGRAFYNIMQHQLQENIGLITCRQQSSFNFQHCMVTKEVTDHNSISLQTREATYFFPLYLYSEPKLEEGLWERVNRTPNLNQKIVDKIAAGINHAFLPDENIVCDLEAGLDGTFSPLNILDYIYAVLHSPEYREKYKDFLKIDFPRVPYSQDAENFWKLVELGGELRQLHLLESPIVKKYITGYPEDGNNIITRRISKNSPGYEHISETQGKVWINDHQYFNNVPLLAWEFYIGGYQPAQKWLKDRQGLELSYEDITHYQKIIVALTETDRLMKEIDEVGVGVEEALSEVNEK